MSSLIDRRDPTQSHLQMDFTTSDEEQGSTLFSPATLASRVIPVKASLTEPLLLNDENDGKQTKIYQHGNNRKRKNLIAIAGTALFVCLLLACGSYRTLASPGETVDEMMIRFATFTKSSTGTGLRELMLRNNAHLTTDKPIYRGGDRLHWRAVIVDAFHGPPPTCNDVRNGQVTLNSPKGDTVFTESVYGQCHFYHPIQYGNIAISNEWVGGDYTLTFTSPGVTIATRTINIRKYAQPPALTIRSDFQRKGYTANETVIAYVHVSRREGGMPVGAAVTAYVTIDGQSIYDSSKQGQSMVVDIDGDVEVKFQLPEYIHTGIGTLTIVVDDSGVTASSGITIPILLASLDVITYPSSGWLVDGVPSRVYFEAHTPLGEPADIIADVMWMPKSIASKMKSDDMTQAQGWNRLDAADWSLLETITQTTTLHEGRGMFEFIPHAKNKWNEDMVYALRVTSPVGIIQPIWLDEIQSSGLNMYATKDTFTSHEPITIQVSIANRPAGIYHICLHQREQILICQDIQLPSSMGTVYTTLVKLTPPLHLDVIHPHAHDEKWKYVHSRNKHHIMAQEEMSGVLRVTLHGDDDDGMNMNDIQQSSVAGLEILIFRHPPGKLLIHVNTSLATVPSIPNSYDTTPTPPTTSIQTSIPTSTSTFAPRQRVNVTVRVTDESGRPVPSLLAMAVVDDSVIQMVEKRKQTPRLMEQIYLENEVQELNDAHIYLATYHTPHQPIPSITEKSSRTTTPEHALNLLLNTQGWRRYAYVNATFMENAIKQGKKQEIKAKQMYGWSEGVQEWMWKETMPLSQYGFAPSSEVAYTPRAMAFHAAESEAIAFRAASPRMMMMMNEVKVPMMVANDDDDDASAVAHEADMNINEMTEQEKKEMRRMRRWGPDKGGRDEDGKDQQDMEKKKMEKRQNKEMEMDEEDQAQDRTPGEPILAKRAAAPVQAAARYVQRRWYDPREYRHMADTTSTTRSDMTQTVFWTTSRTHVDGMASFTFDLSDAITSYRVMIDVLSNPQFAHIVDESESSRSFIRYENEYLYLYHQYTNVQLEKGKTRGYTYGQTDVMIQVKEPFYIQPTFPFEVTGGDHVILPIALINNNAHSISIHTNLSATYEMKEDDDEMISPVSFPRANEMEKEDVIVLMGGERGRTLREMLVAQNAPSNVTLTISSAATPTNTQGLPSHDSVSHTFATVPAGYPIIQSYGGMLKETSHVELTVKIPKVEEIVGGLSSILSSLKLYPSPAATLMQALEALIREPYGCFEQTSATTYPLVMVLQYYRSHSGVNAEKIDRVMKLLENGYSKLVGFECSSGGFDWFGQSPGHEALTAYGLTQFLDMAKVYPVDPAMIRRTSGWILSRQHDDRKGFKRNQRAFQFGAAPEDITDAYIIWSLTYAGIEIPNSHISYLVNLTTSPSISSSSDSYFIGLVAGILYRVGDKTEGYKLAQKLINNQQKDGSVINAKTSITRSGGDSLLIETTSIAVLVWLNDPAEFALQVELAIRFLTSRCADGKFGSTQGTVLALKAIIAYDKYRARNTAKPGAARVMVDGVQIGEDVNLGKSTDDSPSSSSSSSTSTPTDIISLPDISATLTEGEHTIRLELAGGASIPYSATFRYHSIHPSSQPGSPLTFTLKMNKHELTEGEGTQIDVHVTNSKHQGIGMVAAIIGLPSGLEPRHAQLQELVRANKMSFYEVNGRYVILYWRGMGPDQHIHFPIDVVAVLPGEYTGQTSHAYEYYHDEQKVFVKPLHVRITPIQ